MQNRTFLFDDLRLLSWHRTWLTMVTSLLHVYICLRLSTCSAKCFELLLYCPRHLQWHARKWPMEPALLSPADICVWLRSLKLLTWILLHNSPHWHLLRLVCSTYYPRILPVAMMPFRENRWAGLYTYHHSPAIKPSINQPTKRKRHLLPESPGLRVLCSSSNCFCTRSCSMRWVCSWQRARIASISEGEGINLMGLGTPKTGQVWPYLQYKNDISR